MSAPLDLGRLAELQHLLGGDLRAIVASITRNLEQAIAELTDGLAAADFDRAVRAAHAARNDALTIGAEPLLAALTEVESAARDCRLDAAQAAATRTLAIWPNTREALEHAVQTA